MSNVHKTTVEITQKEFDRVNRLLEIKDMSEMSDSELIKIGASTHQNEGIFCAEFDDGSRMNFDLCSGVVNYWDDVVWTSPDGNQDVTLECVFMLNDIEFKIDSELYVVKVIVKEQEDEVMEENICKGCIYDLVDGIEMDEEKFIIIIDNCNNCKRARLEGFQNGFQDLYKAAE